MSEKKIVSLRPSTNSETEVIVDSSPKADLFGHTADNAGKIAFLDITSLDETTLLQIVVRNSVKSVVDLRPRPVFYRPEFQHKYVVNYFLKYNILYVEYALHITSESGAGPPALASHNSTNFCFEECLRRGLTIGLFDIEAKERGWVNRIRDSLSQSAYFTAELHPRSLVS